MSNPAGASHSQFSGRHVRTQVEEDRCHVKTQIEEEELEFQDLDILFFMSEKTFKVSTVSFHSKLNLQKQKPYSFSTFNNTNTHFFSVLNTLDLI